jgi:hypothetical protein
MFRSPSIAGAQGTHPNWCAMGFSQAVAVMLPLLIVYSLYLNSLGHQMVEEASSPILDALLVDFTHGGNYSLKRAPEAVHLEKRIDADTSKCFKQCP